MKFSIDIKLEVDQKQFNFHINKVYNGKIHSIVPFDGKVTIIGDFTLAEKTEIENYYISLPVFEEDYVITQLMNAYEQKEKDDQQSKDSSEEAEKKDEHDGEHNGEHKGEDES